jgi:hypothetical protein
MIRMVLKCTTCIRLAPRAIVSDSRLNASTITDPNAFADALRGSSYNNARSPKNSPVFIFRISVPFYSTDTVPFLMM